MKTHLKRIHPTIFLIKSINEQNTEGDDVTEQESNQNLTSEITSNVTKSFVELEDISNLGTG